MTSEQSACAHITVRYTTETDSNNLTHGWWECQDCHTEFALAKEIDRLRQALAWSRENIQALFRRIDEMERIWS